jgi:hypothetical protein
MTQHLKNTKHIIEEDIMQETWENDVDVLNVIHQEFSSEEEGEEEEAINLAVMKDGSIVNATECQDCYVLILRDNIQHSCCAKSNPGPTAEEQSHFIRNIVSVTRVSKNSVCTTVLTI